MRNFKVTTDNEGNWTDEQMWLGKYNFKTRKTTYLNSLRVSVVIDNLQKLEVITKNVFDVVQRSLVSLSIKNCPLLYNIEQRMDYPHYPLPKLSNIVLEELNNLINLDFLNSQFSSRKSMSIPAHDIVKIVIKNNNNLKWILLNRPLSFKGENNVQLTIDSGPNVSPKGILNACFLKGKLKSLALCESDCVSCGTVWIQAVHSRASDISKKANFSGMDYPWHPDIPSDGRGWTYEAVPFNCGSKPSCRPPYEAATYNFIDWPIDKERISNDQQGLGSLAIKSRCTHEGRWDPYMVHHNCFESKSGWTSCLAGCDCSKTTVVCAHGPYYDRKKRRIVITKEELPNLASIDKHALDNLSENLKIKTFFFSDNPTLNSITADARRFNQTEIKNIIITKSPYLRRVETFVQKTWTGLEYIEFSQLGDSFGRGIVMIMNSVFKAPKPQLRVLDLSFSGIKTFPRIDYSVSAPKLRYLFLAGNKFTSLDIETFYPFYDLPKDVDYIPKILEERTPITQVKYKPRKTLNIKDNANLVCDCRMASEHLSRVGSSVYWDPLKLTDVQVSDMCLPGTSDSKCNIVQEPKTGCVYVGYQKSYVASDLQCLEERLDENDGYSIDSDRLYSGLECDAKEGIVATYCSRRDIVAQDYPYFYCDPFTSMCKPAGANDPVIAALECDPEKTGTEDYCYFYQNLEITCPQRIPYGEKCPTKVLECNPTVRRCQFKPPFKRSDFQIDMCKFHIGRAITKAYWDPTDYALAKKAWVGDCGFRCNAKSDCSSLRKYFDGMNFCCTTEGFCSTNCFEMCPPGWTGLLCETDLNQKPLKCPSGWGGDQCSAKLCNRFFLCSNGATCESSRCKCTDDYFGPECVTHRRCEGNPCPDIHFTYCKSDDGTTYTCPEVSRVFAKYKFLDGVQSNSNCDDTECGKLMQGSVCVGESCGCRYGEVALKKIGRPPRCLTGAAPCTLDTPGECTTLHQEMICSGNPAYIAKVAVRPVAYGSFCLCSLSQFFNTTNGACTNKIIETADRGFLNIGELTATMSGAVIAIICLAVIGVGVAMGSYMVLRKRRSDDDKMANIKKETSLASQLSVKFSATKGAEFDVPTPSKGQGIGASSSTKENSLGGSAASKGKNLGNPSPSKSKDLGGPSASKGKMIGGPTPSNKKMTGSSSPSKSKDIDSPIQP